MPGIRIHHVSERNSTVIVDHPGEIRGLFRTKNKGRKPKQYLIKVDNDGNCIVSETVWDRLQEAGTTDFIVLNTVEDPPTQTLNLNINQALQDLTPPGMQARISDYRG